MRRKTRLAEILQCELPTVCRIGDAATFPSRWVLPIRVCDPDGVCQALRAAGFDATRHASNLTVLDPPENRPDADAPQAMEWAPNLVYLPLHPSLTENGVYRLAGLVGQLNPS